MKKVCIVLAAILTFDAYVGLAQQWTQLGQTIQGDNADDKAGMSVSCNYTGSIIVIGLSNFGSLGKGAVRVYAWNGSQWKQQGDEIIGLAENAYLGYAVGMDSVGKRIVIGSPYEPGNGVFPGSVRVYDWNGTTWSLVGNPLYGSQDAEYFGNAVDISADGNTIVVGRRQNDGGGTTSGAVTVFKWNGSQWVQKGGNILGYTSYARLGASVAISRNGNIIAVGSSNGVESYKGYVRVLEWNGTQWVDRGDTIGGEETGMRLGTAVDISPDGSILVVGAPGARNQDGLIRIYNWNGTEWQQEGEFVGTNNGGGKLGSSVAINYEGNTVVAGEPGTKKVYIIKKLNGTWQKVQELNGSNNDMDFGASVGINKKGNRVIVGAPDLQALAPTTGKAKVFYDKQDTVTSSELIQANLRINKFHIKVQDNIIQIISFNETGTVQLIDLTGKVIVRTKLQPFVQIPVSHIPDGSYVLNIQVEGMQSFRRLIVINKLK